MKDIIPRLTPADIEDAVSTRLSLEDLDQLPRHALLERITDAACANVNSVDRNFMRTFVIGLLNPLPAMMRATIDTEYPDSTVPINGFVGCLGESGIGKGKTLKLIEQTLLRGFYERFTKETVPIALENALWERAQREAGWSGKTDQEEYDRFKTIFRRQGTLRTCSRTITEAAIIQMRNKSILSNSCAVNLQVDEIGQNLSNVSGQYGPLNMFLELYDGGWMKESATKSGKDGEREEEIHGWVPATFLFFGSPSALLDGGKRQQDFMNLLETGYMRRTLFAYADKKTVTQTSARARLDAVRSKQSVSDIRKLQAHFDGLSHIDRLNWHVTLDEDVLVTYLQYQIDCELRGSKLTSEHDILRYEIQNRHFKALKLAGVLAFIDESTVCTHDHFACAVRIVEEAGESAVKILYQEEAHVRLAKWLATKKDSVTLADIHEQPYMKQLTQQVRKDKIELATSWGYTNNVIIKRFMAETVEMYSADTLEETDLDNMQLSYSNDIARDYVPMSNVPWDKMNELVTAPDLHWCNHMFENGHRLRDNMIPGFNMIVLDCDGEVALETVHDLFNKARFMTYTTKRHQTDGTDRFRLILPTNFKLHLDANDYKEFMSDVLDWMPFWSKETSDGGPKQPEKKWLTNPDALVHFNEGELFNVLPFIPKTRDNRSHKAAAEPLRDMGNLERYFLRQMSEGNRNNNFAAYAFALVDTGMSLQEIEGRVRGLNAQLMSPLSIDELTFTVIKSASIRCAQRDYAA